MKDIPINHVHWKACWRAIPTHYPPKNLFERIAEPKDYHSLVELDQLTRDYKRQKQPFNNDYIQAPFAYPNPTGSRFSDGSYGIYYAGKTFLTAIYESKYHREKFMTSTQERPMPLGMRVLVAHLQSPLHDIRGMHRKYADIYSPFSYAASQIFGYALKEQDSNGIVYDSVRYPKGECAAVFKPDALNHCRQERHLVYEWNGKIIEKIYELREYLKT